MKIVSSFKKMSLLLIIVNCLYKASIAQLVITPGAHVTSNGSTTQMVFANTSLINNGIISHTSGTFKFTGSTPSSISGTGTTSLYNFEVSKSAGITLSLSKNIVVKNQLLFTSGLVNLNGYNVDLLSSGALINETEANRITGSNGGYVSTTVNLNAPASANPGNMGAVISSTQNLGTVNIRRGHQVQSGAGSTPGIFRYFDILPANNTSLNATLRFRYFDAELNGQTESNLVLFKSEDNTAWSNEGYTTRDAASNYVEKTGINSFSKWTLSAAPPACEVMQIFYHDADGDGYGSNTTTVQACSLPHGYVTVGGDCNDTNAFVNPGATEICGNSIDDNCNGQTDEGCNTTSPVLTIHDQTVFESQGTVQLTVTLSAASASTVKVKYKTVNGTATHPKDYLRASGDLTFAPGETSKTITVTIVADNTIEPTEYFDVQFSDAVGATINDPMGRVTITEAALTDAPSTGIQKANELEAVDVFNVQVSRNPSQNYFTLDVITTSKEPVQIRIIDNSGRIIENLRKGSFRAINIGSNYRTGVYLAEITQGQKRRTVKLIKF